LVLSSDIRMNHQRIGGSGFQEGTRQAKDTLERRSEEGLRRMRLTWEEAETADKNGVGDCMECGQMRPHGRGLKSRSQIKNLPHFCFLSNDLEHRVSHVV